MILNSEILKAVAEYTNSLEKIVTLVLYPGQHSKRQQLEQFLQQLCSASDKLIWRHGDQPGRSGASFYLEVDGEHSGIIFSGIPGGHEFNSLILAILHSGGVAGKLDSSIQSMISAIDEPLHFEVFVSLSCHNCPDVVQTLNQFASLNPLIDSEMIDGGLFPELIEKRNIQGVPSVYLNGEVFATGKVDGAQLIEKLQQRYPHIATALASTEPMPQQDVTVIGGGPAGVAAAIYAARKGLSVTVIADRIGGQVKDTMAIENLISVPETNGPELSNALAKHLQQYPITVREQLRVEQLEKGTPFTLHLSSGEQLQSRTIIIATGARWRELGIPGEQENIGNGVAYCPHCDGPFYQGKDVAVIGGGNSGVEAALDLAGIVKSVTVVEFMPDLKADDVLIKQIEKTANIKVISNAACEEIISENGKVNGIRYRDREGAIEKTLEVDGVFVQIGLLPNSQFLQGVVSLNKMGEIIINDKGETSEPGLFACGDVTTVPYKQIVTAMGEGAKAALTAFDYLLKQQ